MLFQTNLVELLLLLLIVISFSWIGTHKQMIMSYNGDIIENLENENSVPDCSGSKDVPPCYNTVVSEYDPYGYDSNYILKTKIVPPVCPACPSVINNHSHSDNLYDGLVNKAETSIIQESTEINQSAEISNNSNEEYNSVTNIENTTINNLDNNDKSEDKPKDSKSHNSKIMSDEILKRQQQFYNKEKESINSSQCPPCPACERCPEPAFTCEKVINYKSPSSKQYLPMPVLNDFSTFPSS